MPARRKSRIVWTILFVAWLCVVWGHSLMSGDMSSAESSRFLFLVRPFFELFGCSDEQLMTLVIRKGAHFSEYAVLTIIGTQFARAWCSGVKAARWVTLAIWLFVPMVDETIQRFSPGRSPQITDVLIDMSGGLTGILLAWLLCRRKTGQ